MGRISHVAMSAALMTGFAVMPAEAAPPPARATADLSVSWGDFYWLPGRRAATYTMIVTNEGPSTAQNITVSGTLPSYLTFARIIPGECGRAARGFHCMVPDLLPQTSVLIKLTVKAEDKARGVKRFKVATSSATLDPNVLNNARIITGKVRRLDGPPKTKRTWRPGPRLE